MHPRWVLQWASRCDSVLACEEILSEHHNTWHNTLQYWERLGAVVLNNSCPALDDKVSLTESSWATQSACFSYFNYNANLCPPNPILVQYHHKS